MYKFFSIFGFILVVNLTGCVYLKPSQSDPGAQLHIELLTQSQGATGQLAIGSNLVCDTRGKMIFGDNKFGNGYQAETRIVAGVPTTLRFRVTYTKSSIIYFTPTGAVSSVDNADCGYKIVFTPEKDSIYRLTFEHQLPQADKCDLKL